MQVLKVKKHGASSFTDVLVQPASFQVDLQDLDSESGSGRTQQGYMTRDRKRGADTTVRKLSMTFPPCYDKGVNVLLQAVKHEWLDVNYPDPYTGGYRTGTFYVGDRSAKLYRYDTTLEQWLWTDISFNLTEK